LFVDASGNVSLGQTSSALQSGGTGITVYGTSNSEIKFLNSSTGATASDGTALLTSSLNFQINNREIGDLIFGTSNQERLRITSTGALNFVGGGTAGVTQAVSFSGGAPVNSLVIDSSGRLGLGTSSPSAVLHVAGGASSRAGFFTSTDTNTYSPTSYSQYHRIYLQGGSATGAYNGIGFTNSSNAEGFFGCVQNSSGYADFVFQSFAGSYAEKMRITSAGNVGIGTTAPSFTTDITGTFRVTGEGRFDNGINLKTSTLNYVYYDDAIAFSKNGTGEAFRVDSSRRLLVGTSSTSATSTAVFASRSDAAAAPLVAFHTTESTVTNGANFATLSFGNTATTGTNGAAFIQAQRDGGTWTNNSSMPGRLTFSTTADGASSPTERMRIRSNGVISTFNSVGDSLNLYNASSAGASNAFIYGLHSATNNVSGGTTSFIVYTNGSVVNTNNSYGAISDLKLKENIVDATSQWSDIKALQVRKYNFKEGQTHTQIGLIAQEVELVSPGLVSESPDRDAEGNDLGTVTKSVNYSVLYMKAVKALQEAMERIETLEAKVAALEAA
jgi:hypothetical protein